MLARSWLPARRNRTPLKLDGRITKTLMTTEPQRERPSRILVGLPSPRTDDSAAPILSFGFANRIRQPSTARYTTRRAVSRPPVPLPGTLGSSFLPLASAHLGRAPPRAHHFHPTDNRIQSRWPLIGDDLVAFLPDAGIWWAGQFTTGT